MTFFKVLRSGLGLALLVQSAFSPFVLARDAQVEVGSESELEKSISKVVQYNKASGSGSAIVLAENARGEQILLTNSQNMGRFYRDVYGKYIEITDWSMDNSLAHVGSGPLARIPKLIDGVLKYSQSVGFYRPRPKFEGSVENSRKLLPGTDFGLTLNTNRTEFDLAQFDRLYHDEFVKGVEFSEVISGDSVFVSGVSVRNYPSSKAMALAAIVATTEKAQELLSETIYDENGRSEAAIPFEPAHEILVLSTDQVKGFSGGALLDESGRLAGVITRSGTTQSGVHFYRVLKSSYIEARLADVQFPDKIRPLIKTLLENPYAAEPCHQLIIPQQVEPAPEVEEVVALDEEAMLEVEAPRMAALTSNSLSTWSRLKAKFQEAFSRTLQGPDAK